VTLREKKVLRNQLERVCRVRRKRRWRERGKSPWRVRREFGEYADRVWRVRR